MTSIGQSQVRSTGSSEHAPLECPECGTVCNPQYDLQDGGASYLCTNSDEHADFRDLRFTIDEDGEVTW